MNFAKFLRTPFLTEHLRWLLLEREKISLLRKAGGNFDVKINSLNELVKDELNWWLESIGRYQKLWLTYFCQKLIL